MNLKANELWKKIKIDDGVQNHNQFDAKVILTPLVTKFKYVDEWEQTIFLDIGPLIFVKP